MCSKALVEVEFLANRDIKFLDNTNAGQQQSYTLLEENHLNSEVQAFSCPTLPLIYLEVQDIENIDGRRTYWIWVIMERFHVPPKFDEDLNYQYQLVVVQSVKLTIGT